MSRCTKEEFVECVSELAEHYKKFNDWIDGLEEYLPGAFEGIIENNFFEDALTFLGVMVDDKNEWLDYYFFEKKLEWFEYDTIADGKTHKVESYEELYDLIAEGWD